MSRTWEVDPETRTKVSFSFYVLRPSPLMGEGAAKQGTFFIYFLSIHYLLD